RTQRRRGRRGRSAGSPAQAGAAGRRHRLRRGGSAPFPGKGSSFDRREGSRAFLACYLSLMWTVAQLDADLDKGRTTSRELVEQALSRIADGGGEGKRAFLKVYSDSARAD